jgi:hypothetical protein
MKGSVVVWGSAGGGRVNVAPEPEEWRKEPTRHAAYSRGAKALQWIRACKRPKTTESVLAAAEKHDVAVIGGPVLVATADRCRQIRMDSPTGAGERLSRMTSPHSLTFSRGDS